MSLSIAFAHGEEAYCFLDDVTGLVPTVTAEQRASDRLDRIHAATDYKGQTILDGKALEEGQIGSGHSHPHPKENGESELKVD